MGKQKTLLSIFFLMIVFIFFGFGIPAKLQKKVKKEIVNVFDTDEVTFVTVTVADPLNDKLPKKITDENFFILKEGKKLLGYAFLDKAPSKTAKFDYLVLFNDKLQIVSSKVLIYREEYGGEIGSRRWLKQFLGLSGKDRVSLDNNIDAISGATISVRSMTRAMDKLLQTIGLLQENKII